MLPAGLAADPQFRQRFDCEARAISSLDHPHICVLHDVGHADGIDFLVMQYLEGETLAARLARGPLPLAEALRCGIEIAEALDKAHRSGILHRDLKPGNIMLTKAGARLLDFGLARLAAVETVPARTAAPTATSPLTGQGTILGTLQYMAPEQLEGRDVDARSDLFSFGAMLYEMVTGAKAFDGGSQATIIAAILEREPAPMSTRAPLTPPALDRVARKCLAKDPDARWQSARDLGDELAWIAQGSGVLSGVPALPVRKASRRRTAPLLLTTALVPCGRRRMVGWRGPPACRTGGSPVPAHRDAARCAAGSRWHRRVTRYGPEFSPDGRWVDYVSTESGAPEVYVVPFPGPGGKRRISSDGGAATAWSRDGSDYQSGDRMMRSRCRVALIRSASRASCSEGPFSPAAARTIRAATMSTTGVS